MRIAHVVTMVSPDAAYGGPVRVAANQAATLSGMGHDVHLFASSRGFAQPPDRLGSVGLTASKARRLIPGTGFAGLTAPGMFARLRARMHEFDVVHVHLARDLVTLPAARLAIAAGRPVVLQTHGMIDRSLHPLAGPLDRFLTRPVLAAASAVFYLTEVERRELVIVSRGSARLRLLPNGVPRVDGAESALDGEKEVLFLARLHRRKRPLDFVRAAGELAPRFPEYRFTLVGPDEGEGPEVQRLIDAIGCERISWTGPLAPEATLGRMRRSRVYVLPSVDEPFPMSVLEAASAGRPVVITSSCGLAGYVRDHEAGFVVEPGVEPLVRALTDLLDDPADLERRGANARRMVRDRLDMGAVGEILERVYQESVRAADRGVAGEAES